MIHEFDPCIGPGRMRPRPLGPTMAYRAILLAGCIWLALPSDSPATWPQYRGLNHDGISTETIRTNWQESPPREVWKIPLGPGLSSLTVSGGKVFTQVRRTVQSQSQEVCVALNADTGQEIWATSLGIADYPHGGVGSDDGPRSTPSVDGDSVYVLTSYLRLVRLEADSGRILWSKNLVAEYGGVVPAWQNAASPLIEDGIIYLNCGARNQALLALRTADGSGLWKGQSDAMTQATPVVATVAGVRQVIFFAQSGLISTAAETGSVLWRYPFPFSVSTAASPVVAGDTVYCSAAYGVGAGAVRITDSEGQLTASPLWRTPGGNMNHWATPVHHDGFLYGVYGQAGPTTTLRCIELATGAEKWRQPGPGEGGVLFTTGLILMLTEEGYLVLVKPDPSAYAEIGRYRALDGGSSSIPGLPVKCWNVPALSRGRIYVRSTTEAVCLDVAPPAPRLVTLSGLLSSGDGTFQLRIRDSEGIPLDASRAAGISVLVSTNPALDAASWRKLTNAPVLTEGQLVLTDPESSTVPGRFFRTQEQP